MGPNIYMFTFPSEKVVQDIMSKSPWAVMNNILSLQKWNPDAAAAEIDFSHVPIWVQIHGLAFGAMTVTNATKLMRMVGEILEVEEPMVDGVLVRSFMRARINFNTMKQLPTGCWVPRKNQPKTWVMFLYEKLQGYCYGCGTIGHEQKDCGKIPCTIAISKEILLYGARLSVPPAKPLSWIVREQQRWRRETDVNAGSRQSRIDKDSAESSQKSNNGGRGKDGDDPVQLKKVMGPQEEKEHVQQLAEVMGLQQQNLGAETSLVRSSR